jgi:predicted dehydrogenase
MVDHTFPYTGSVRKVKELVEAGEIGEPYYYDSVRVNLGLFQKDVSVIWDLAVHDLSIMDFIFGLSPVAVSCTGIRHIAGQPVDVAYLTLFFEGNFMAHLHVNWLSPVKLRRTLIGGSSKMIVYDDLDAYEKVRVHDKGLIVEADPEQLRQMLLRGYRSGDVWSPQVDSAEALGTELNHFANCIRNGATPMTDGAAGFRVVHILEAAEQSLFKKGAPVELKSILQEI